VGSRSGKKDEEGRKVFEPREKTKIKNEEKENCANNICTYIQFVVFLISLLRVKSNVDSEAVCTNLNCSSQA
jgi:hypothetical protein